MTPSWISIRRYCALFATLLSITVPSFTHAAAADGYDESSLPETLRRGYKAPIDGPANDKAYAHGNLGLIRPGFGRASLFVAWRVMHLPVGAVANESLRRQGDWVNGPFPASSPDVDELAVWLKARAALVPTPPSIAPDYYRQTKFKSGGIELDSVTGQCGPDAFTFATRTLGGLVADGSLKDGDRRRWIADQDAVFARCVWTPGKLAIPKLPAPLPKQAPAKLQALQAYQLASALFYGDEYVAARQAFDAIAAVPDHPMRAWATLGGMRSVVRDAVRDTEWEAAVDEAWGQRQLRGAAFNAAVAAPAARHDARTKTALQDIEARGRAAFADATLAPAHGAIRYTLRRAFMQMAPAVPFGQAVIALDRPEYNPYAMGALDLIQAHYPSLFTDRPSGPSGQQLRQHAWFDFVVTVQACSDAQLALEPTACAEEHAHAMARWQDTHDNAWLLATLMTARQPTAADLSAAEAARAVPADRAEWASLQLYAARVLRLNGRGADARTAVDALAVSKVIHKRDRALVDAERLAL